jgi:hypothetical protein
VKTIHSECSDKPQLVLFGMKVEEKRCLVNNFLDRIIKEEEISRALGLQSKLKVDDVGMYFNCPKRWCLGWGRIYAEYMHLRGNEQGRVTSTGAFRIDCESLESWIGCPSASLSLF